MTAGRVFVVGVRCQGFMKKPLCFIGDVHDGVFPWKCCGNKYGSLFFTPLHQPFLLILLAVHLINKDYNHNNIGPLSNNCIRSLLKVSTYELQSQKNRLFRFMTLQNKSSGNATMRCASVSACQTSRNITGYLSKLLILIKKTRNKTVLDTTQVFSQ